MCIFIENGEICYFYYSFSNCNVEHLSEKSQANKRSDSANAQPTAQAYFHHTGTSLSDNLCYIRFKTRFWGLLSQSLTKDHTSHHVTSTSNNTISEKSNPILLSVVGKSLDCLLYFLICGAVYVTSCAVLCDKLCSFMW